MDCTPAPKKKQTVVYVTGLPDDVTRDELHDHFAKVGVIMDDMFTGGPRIKIYENDDGTPKGDALIVYLCEPSVQLAIDILDESQLRPGVCIRVSRASFEDVEQSEQKHVENEGTEPSSKQRKVDKETWRKQMKEMKRKIAWDEDKEEGVVKENPYVQKQQNKQHRVVVLRHMFTKAEIEEDPKAILDIKEDILFEAEKFSPVTSVYLFEDSEDGRCAVKFRSADAAIRAIEVFDGRYFAGQRIKAELYDGSFKLKESKHKANEADDDEERLERFADWLEQEQDQDV